jgi:hypothetical protein
MSFFSFTKLEYKRVEQILPGRGSYQWKRGEVGERV